MSEITPVDQLTGLPLPILPPEEFSAGADWHHHFHPRRSPLLMDLGGQAVRCVRLQRANYNTHHNEYHGYFDGPPLPETVEDKFFTVIMATAYIPKHALDFSLNSPRVVEMSDEERRRLFSSKELRIASKAKVQDFVRTYILSQKFDTLGLSELVIEEFLRTKDIERRHNLGHFILGQATEKAVEPLEQPYRQAWKEHLIPAYLPRTAQKFTKTQLGPRKLRDKLIPRLQQQLSNAA